MKSYQFSIAFLRTDVGTSDNWEVDYFRRPYGLFLLLFVFL